MTFPSLLLAAVLVPLLLIGWVWVQNAWRRTLSQPGDDEDVLAARGGGCGKCTCATPCRRSTAAADK